MASLTRLGSGNWRVQVRRKGHYLADTFRRRKDAEEWALDVERRIDRGEAPSALKRSEIKLVADLIDLHIADMHECPSSNDLEQLNPFRSGGSGSLV
jgi:hypothetical protein